MIFQRRAVKLSVASSANVLSLWARFAMLALLEVWSLVLRILCSFFQFEHSSPRGWGQKTDCEQSTFSRAWYCWCFFLWLSRDAPLVNCIFCFKLRLNHCAVSVGYDWLKWLFWLNGAVLFLGFLFIVLFSFPERPCWLSISSWRQTRWGAAPEQVWNERTKRDRRSL